MQLTASTLFLLTLLAVAVVFWHDGMRVRERANRVALDACRRASVQLLDGTVALAKLRPRFTAGVLRIERTYVFDYTAAGVGRASGFLIMLGDELRHVGFESGAAH